MAQQPSQYEVSILDNLAKTDHYNPHAFPTWDAFAEHVLFGGVATPDKMQQRMIVLAVLRGPKKDANVERMGNVLMVDFDGATLGHVRSVCKRLTSEDVPWFFYTSASNTAPLGSANDVLVNGRLAMPIHAPTPKEWKAFWGRAVKDLGAQVDQACKAVSQGFFMPHPDVLALEGAQWCDKGEGSGVYHPPAEIVDIKTRTAPKQQPKADDALRSGVVSIIEPLWVVGDRNDLAMLVSGYLARQGIAQADVEVIVSEICERTKDDPSARLTMVARTFERLAKNEHVSGTPMLKEKIGAEAFGKLEAIAGHEHRLICKGEKRLPNLANIVSTLEGHEAWCGSIAWNSFARKVERTRELPKGPGDATLEGALGDVDVNRMQIWFTKKFGSEPADTTVRSAIRTVAENHKFHPVQDYLRGFVWDGVPRLESLFPKLFCVEPTPLNARLFKLMAKSCVARAMLPGCKVDTMLVIFGAQGNHKSTGIETLCPDPKWYSNTPLPVGDKDAYQQLNNVWLYEMGELESFRGKEESLIKGYLSAHTDKYRPSYGRSVEENPRGCVFIGTTNKREYLTDITGNRRFWPVVCEGKADLDEIRKIRDQIWAEAYASWGEDPDWWSFSAELQCELDLAHKASSTEDPWVEVIEMGIVGLKTPAGQALTSEFSLDTVFNWLGIPSERKNRARSSQVRAVLETMGFEEKGPGRDRTRKMWSGPNPLLKP